MQSINKSFPAKFYVGGLLVCALSISACDAFQRKRGAHSTDALPSAPAKTVANFSLRTIEGVDEDLATHKGKVLLVVNVASKCGFTPQYRGLQELYETLGPQGLVVMGVPSNDFLGQEPGTEEEIQTFCTTKFHVTFPMYSKVKVTGDDKHPLYAWMSSEHGGVSWNFNKFLIGRDGQVIERFGSTTAPLDDELVEAVTKALAAAPPK